MGLWEGVAMKRKTPLYSGASNTFTALTLNGF